MLQTVTSWGRTITADSFVHRINWRTQPIIFEAGRSYLPVGALRSYGDCCLNDKSAVFDLAGLNRFISFNRETGELECEAGISLRKISDIIVPQGWFLPVTPGTQWVTLGGAIANDVHGKNHHKEGSFGCAVLELELLRSNGEKLRCSRSQNNGLFRATIGGLGLTGIILSAKIKLKKISSAGITAQNIPFSGLDEYLELSARVSPQYEYTVAWLDCANLGAKFGRGILMCGSHDDSGCKPRSSRRFSVPEKMPSWLLNNFLIGRFNEVYHFVKSRSGGRTTSIPYEPFFYPLDALHNWNALYGKQGFFQLQFVVPQHDNGKALKEILEEVRRSGTPSYLAVLKDLGPLASPGILSFPREGHTLCLDFANRGRPTAQLLSRLNKMAIERGGAIYPAKDATMLPAEFAASYPTLEEFIRYRDPKFSSSFWRRVTSA
ncbi:MAG: FAD-binding oxidoreductase [Deltaproteobacteria bacterium]|nr:FAD-binding oxidoreductase [Deltaproteobacteria bacterium]